MQYPLISEYVRAIQDASSNLDKLAHLVPVLDDHGGFQCRADPECAGHDADFQG